MQFSEIYTQNLKKANILNCLFLFWIILFLEHFKHIKIFQCPFYWLFPPQDPFIVNVTGIIFFLL